MSVIVRLQNLPWAANAVDIRQYFHGLSIPEGGVHIVGGELGDAFIAFSTDEDARQAMLRDSGKIKEISIKLYLSSRAEMQKIIDQARQQSLGMQQFMSMPAMAPISVPVTSIAVPSMPVPSVSIPDVQNVPGMQVPLQNVAAMVTNITSKPESTPIVRSGPPIAVLTDQSNTKPAVSTSQIIKSGAEKEKKDKHRRRTRSHSRGSSDSRSDSRSRSRSRSSSRSRDRKGRDRHYDRRRRRSRSRDRRRRRDRSRSRERSHRDRRKDHRHGSREEFEDAQTSRWGNPAQRNRQNKSQRPDFHNRDSQNRSGYPIKPNFQKSDSNINSARSQFLNENINQTNSNDSSASNSLRTSIPSLSQSKEDKSILTSSSLPPSSISGPEPPTTTSASGLTVSRSALPTPQNILPNISQSIMPPTQNMIPTTQSSIQSSQNGASNGQSIVPNNKSMSPSTESNIKSSQSFYGNLPPPPMFNPQPMMNYPNFSPSSLAPFSAPPFSELGPPHQMNFGSLLPGPVSSTVQESDDKKDVGSSASKESSPLRQKSETEQMPNTQNKHKADLQHERENKSRFSSDAVPNDIPLPNNQAMLGRGNPFGWGGYNENYQYGKKNDEKPESALEKNYRSDWSNVPSSNNPISKRSNNTCVQIKHVPAHTKHEDIVGFFRTSQIDPGCLKIVGDSQGNRSGAVYVKFKDVGDKKKAICRSGCLLNNAIVTVLHVDDEEFNKALDVSEFITPPYWNMNAEHMGEQHRMDDALEMMNNMPHLYNAIKFDGSMRYHPFYNNKHSVHPHIRSLLDSFHPVDACIVKLRGQNIHAFLKFETVSSAEAAIKSLKNAKIEDMPVTVTICTDLEFSDAKNNSIKMDVEHFLKSGNSQKNIINKPNIKQDERVDPRLYSSSYPDIRPKPEDSHDEPFNDDVEMKISEEEAEEDDEEVEPEFKRSNKVLLPTPPPLMQTPLLREDPLSNVNTNCILMQNLPLQANDRDILDFFSEIGLVPTQIHIMLDANGKQYGDAFCEFESNEEAVSASTKNSSQIGRNFITVRLVSRQEMSMALGFSVLTSGPNQPCGPPQNTPSFFNKPMGPPGMFGSNMRMDSSRGGNDWSQYHSGGAPGSNQPPSFNNMNLQSDHSFRQGSRGIGNRGRGDDGSSRGARESIRGGRGVGDSLGRGGRGVGDNLGRGGRGGGDSLSRGGRGGGDSGIRGGRGGMDSSIRGGRGVGDSNKRGGRGGIIDSRGRGGRNDSIIRSRDGFSRGGRVGVDGFSRVGRGEIGEGGSWNGRVSSDNINRGGRLDSLVGGRGLRGAARGMRGGRGRGMESNQGNGRGGRDGNDYPRSLPPDLMSLPSALPPSGDQNSAGFPPLLPQPTSVTRPIQLEEDSVREFGHPGCVVSAENVPYRAELNDILDFFREFDLTAESVIRRYNDLGQITGDARIAFKSPAEARRAIKYLNNERLLNRKVSLNLFK